MDAGSTPVVQAFALSMEISSHEDEEEVARVNLTFTACCRLEFALFVVVSVISIAGLVAAAMLYVSARPWIALCDTAVALAGTSGGYLVVALLVLPLVWSIDVVWCRSCGHYGRQRFGNSFCCCFKKKHKTVQDTLDIAFGNTSGSGLLGSSLSSRSSSLIDQAGSSWDDDELDRTPRSAFVGGVVRSPGISTLNTSGSSSSGYSAMNEMGEMGAGRSGSRSFGEHIWERVVAPRQKIDFCACAKRRRTCGCCLRDAWRVARVLIVVAAVSAAFASVLAAILWTTLLHGPQVLAGPRIVDHALLSAPATLHVTHEGMIHIEAATEHDANFMQGYATAEMRLWQLEMQRRIGAGTLAEVAGKGALPTDKMMRTLGIYDAAVRTLAVIKDADASTYDALMAYVDGVNAYLEQKPSTQLPVEFKILGYRPAKWTAVDSIVWIKLMAMELSGNLKDELERYKLLHVPGMTPARLAELKPPFDHTQFPTILNMEDLASDNVPIGVVDAASVAPSDEIRDWLASLSLGQKTTTKKKKTTAAAPGVSPTVRLPLVGLFRDLQARASNNWVVGPTRTKAGAPLLCNDPHLTLTAPSIWLIMHKRWSDVSGVAQDVVGATFSGLPGIVIGRNNNISWGVTNTAADCQDLFVLTVNEKNEYSVDGVWHPLQVRREIITVYDPNPITNPWKKKTTEEIFVRTAGRFGPIITDNGVFSAGPNADIITHPLAMSWTSTDPTLNDTTLVAFYHMNKAVDWATWRQALSHYIAPAQNFVFAAKSGDFGYQMPGILPRRALGHTGRTPVLGNVSRYAWRDFNADMKAAAIAFDALPRALNPPKGYVASANNRPTPIGFAKPGFALSNDWDEGSDGFRARRITEMIVGSSADGRNGSAPGPIEPVHDVSTMRSIQLDYNSSLFHAMKPLFTSTSASSSLCAASRLSDASKAWCAKLAVWDGVTSVGSEEASVWARFWLSLRRLTDQNVGAAMGEEYTADILLILRSVGFPDFTSSAGVSNDPACVASGARDCIDFAAMALNNATASSGVSVSHAPRWGIDIHKARFAHQILGQIPALQCFSDRLTPHGGDGYTVNVGHMEKNMGTMEQLAGPSYRHIVDWSAVDANSLFLNPLGQSGDEFSPLYDNLVTSWSKGEYLAMTTILPPFKKGKEEGDIINRKVSPAD